MNTQTLAVKKYRQEHPRSRIVSVYRYGRNGASVKRRDCALCGHEGISWCARYPRTVQSEREEYAHAATCAAAYLTKEQDNVDG